MHIIGLRIKQRRKDLALSQIQIAEKVGVSVQVISALENGKQKDIRPNNLTKLCIILKCTSDYLYGITDINDYNEVTDAELKDIININHIRLYPEAFQLINEAAVSLNDNDKATLLRLIKAFINK